MSFGGPRLPEALLGQVHVGRVTKSRPQQSPKDARQAERKAKRAAVQTRPTTSATHPSRPREESSVQPPHSTRKPSQSTGAINDRNVSKKVKHTTAEPRKKVSKSRSEEVDDDEIATLEKKLGLNRKKSKKTGDDELDWLLFGSDGEGGEDAPKRKRPEDNDWLRKKRLKSGGYVEEVLAESDVGEDDGESDLDTDGSLGQEEDLSEIGGDLDGDSKESEEEFEKPNQLQEHQDDNKSKRQRENPYLPPPAPHGDKPVTKYVPPSMRIATNSDDETMNRLRRQLQGLLNRLSEDNIMSIISSIQDVYSNNARQHVTGTLIQLLRDRVCDPSTLSDTFLILHAGFATALYRTVGTDFGAQLLESFINAFDSHHKRQELSVDRHQTLAEGKQTLNLVAFLCDFYVLQAISSTIIFDYLRILLDRENFSEANTELLLRIIRICGPQLRQDDPTALKDVVILLQKTVSAIGESNVSVRTKFMIETIHNLKNNRMKTGLAASALSAEHTQRMKKALGNIKSVKTSEPLRITMADIRDSDKKGKWWLVGASWRDPAKTATAPETTSINHGENDGDTVESDSEVDLNMLAGRQGMNTDVRRAIFVAMAGAVDFQHAYVRVMKLNLKSKQLLELPQVLLHCMAAEKDYNHFYSLLATKFCGDQRMRNAYQLALLDLFRRMGERSDITGDEDDDQDDSLEVRKIYNLAKLYATLIAEGLLRLTVLKSLDFTDLQIKTKIFVEVLLSTVFILVRKKTVIKPKAEREAEYESSIRALYNQALAASDIASGLRYFLSSVLPTSHVAANPKEASVIETGCEYAVESLASAPSKETMSLSDDASAAEW